MERRDPVDSIIFERENDEDDRCCLVAVLTHRSTKKKKKPMPDRVFIGPMIAPGRERKRGRDGHTHTNSYERKRNT
jgi:hypothetical protein